MTSPQNLLSEHTGYTKQTYDMTIEKATKELLISSPFYGTVLLGMTKIESTSVPTMCITLHNGAAIIMYNPIFWNSLTEEQQVECLKHELLHICLFHPFQAGDFDDHKTMNIAADGEVNQYLNIKNLPDGCVDLMSWYPNWPEKAGMREYYRRLKAQSSATSPKIVPNPDMQDWQERNSQQQQCQSSGGGPKDSKKQQQSQVQGSSPSQQQSQQVQHPTRRQQRQKPNQPSTKPQMDEIVNHDTWKKIQELPESQKELLKAHIETVVLEASESCGNTPGEMMEIIGKIKAKNVPKFDWKGYLRRLIGIAEERYIKFTYRRPSKRYDDAKGAEHKRQHKLLLALDCSGSVSAKEVHEFYATMCSMQKTGVDMDVVEFDTQIIREYKFKTWDGTIQGRGGTYFDCVYTYANENRRKYNAVVILTDGYCSMPNFKCLVPLIWVISSNGAKKDYPGVKVFIPQENESNNN